MQDYDHGKNHTLLVYSLEEIVLEKMRAILQQTKKLHEQGWSRSRSRDYYDLWRIFSDYDINYDDFPVLFQQKCSLKDVNYSKVDDFFDPHYLKDVKRTWDKWLAQTTSNLPPYDVVIPSVQTKLGKILKL